MKKIAFLISLCILSTAIITLTHYHGYEFCSWSRLLIVAPIVYAGVNFRRSGAISVAMLLVMAQGPILVIEFSRGLVPMEHISVIILISIVSVLLGHILFKEKENSQTLEHVYNLIRSMHKNINEDSLLTMLETVFADRAKSDEVATYIFGSDGALRPRKNPEDAPLPQGHLFYTVAEKREFMTSANPAHDSRLIYYGPENALTSVSQLAVFPIEYGGRVRGVISVANSVEERFEKNAVAILTAMKQSIESALDLGEKLRGRIQHELQRKKIRDTFSSYLSRTVAEEILKDPDRLDLGGEVREVTIMFTEVTNFKDLLRTVPPEELLARLNEFFSIAIDTVFEFNGTLDKFIGDNIMAFWGAPLAIPDCEHKAVACAQVLHHKLARLNTGWEHAGSQPFNVCIGINSGAVVAGNIGSIRRMEYTIIGDTVNTASRIKSLSKSKGIPILLGETTYLRVKDSIKIEQRFEASLKGKAGSITVYQVAV